ncbi:MULTISPECIES: hypothetical protein [unclassified Virgibacillus]|nr:MULTISPECIES: hypothetical protein [unclassified Virgibacillus]MDY7044867.1 hypothetical protein [Virgibacillus sp. M23]
MGRNRNDKDNNQDVFDRALFGSPGFMIIVALLVIIGSIVFNYFK